MERPNYRTSKNTSSISKESGKNVLDDINKYLEEEKKNLS